MPKPAAGQPPQESNTADQTKAATEINPVSALRKTFRSYASTLTLAGRTAYNLSQIGGKPKTDPKVVKDEQLNQKHLKDTAREIPLRRQKIREETALLEGKLRGNAKESQALHCMLRSQPCVGGNKRKFTLVSDGDEDR
ncbi:hypothetical protein ACHAWO_002922 [Cyclotella atomus]|jgi:hypothetical protein|uniref:Uncharacterized protein n=1 Tax=Cyclotella atomus TaxID=382360 RepID=A0ABD3QGL2_9STRA